MLFGKKEKIKIIILAGAALFVAFGVWFIMYVPNKNLEVDFLDVGQGDAILIKTPAGQNILIDGGPDSAVVKRLSENLPWWDRQIDLMILTHPHDDHVAGQVDVLKRYSVKKIFYTGTIHTTPSYLEWLRLVRAQKIPVFVSDGFDKINLGKDSEINFVYPQEGVVGQNQGELENLSLAGILKYKNVNFFLSGEMDTEAEAALSVQRTSLRSAVLKVSHHGSDTATSLDFLAKIRPEYAIISVGRDNKFGHPSQRIIKRLERAGAKILRTDNDGTIGFLTDGERLWLK